MNLPFIVIVLPLLLAIILFILRRKSGIVGTIAAIFCVVLALLVVKLPVDTGIPFGKFSINISSTWLVLGRKFVIEKTDLPFVTMIFGLGATWFIAAAILKITNPFASIGVGILGLLCAAVSVEPFIYSAMILELITILSVAIMVEKGQPQDKGLMKYLIYQTLGFPFILFTGWVLNVAGVNPSDQVLLFQAILFLGLGFALWLGVFPFFSWIPMLMEGVNPLIAGFILVMIPTVILLLIIDFLDGFAWLRDAPIFYTALTVSGLIMVISSGIWAAFSKSIARLLGYAIIIQTGLSLIAIGSHSRIGLEYLVLAIVPRIIAVLIWSFVLVGVRNTSPGFEHESVSDYLHLHPMAALSIFIAMFSMAGTPFLGSFSLKVSLLITVAKTNLPGAIIAVGGLLGLLIGITRQLWHMFKSGSNFSSGENLSTRIFLIAGIAAILLVGLFPKELLSNLSGTINSFKYLNWQ